MSLVLITKTAMFMLYTVDEQTVRVIRKRLGGRLIILRCKDSHYDALSGMVDRMSTVEELINVLPLIQDDPDVMLLVHEPINHTWLQYHQGVVTPRVAPFAFTKGDPNYMAFFSHISKLGDDNQSPEQALAILARQDAIGVVGMGSTDHCI